MAVSLVNYEMTKNVMIWNFFVGFYYYLFALP